MPRIGRAFPSIPHIGKPIVFAKAVPGTPGQLVVTTHFFAAQYRSATSRSRFPNQWSEASETQIVGGAQDGQTIWLSKRALGPDPPAVVTTTSSPPVVTEIQVIVWAARSRVEQARRFPLQGWTAVSTQGSGEQNPGGEQLLDDFNRADSNPISGNWTTNTWNLPNPLQIVGQQIAAVNNSGSYWSTAIADPLTASALITSASPGYQISLKGQGGGGYSVAVSTSSLSIRRFTSAGGFTTIASAKPPTPLGIGDRVALNRNGSLLSVWISYSSGPWQFIFSTSDATTSGPFFPGIFAPGSTLDDFWAGPAVTLSTPFVQRLLGPKPPTVLISANAVPLVTQVLSNLASASTRASEVNRFPLQGWEGEVAYGVIQSGLIPSGSGFSFGNAAGSVEKAAGQITSSYGCVTANATFRLGKAGAPTDNVIVSIQGDNVGAPDGVALASSTIPAASIPGAAPTQFTVPLVATLSAGSTYWLVFERDGALNSVVNFTLETAPRVGGLVQAQLINGVWKPSSTTNGYFYFVSSDVGFGLPKRLLGPRPPLRLRLVSAIATPVSTLFIPAVSHRTEATSLQAKSLLFPPATLAQPPPPVFVRVVLAQTQRTFRRFPLQTQQGTGLAQNGGSWLQRAGTLAYVQGLDYTFGDDPTDMYLGQQFVGVVGNVLSIKAGLTKFSSPSDVVVIELRADDGGQPSDTILATSSSVPGSSIPGAINKNFEFSFSPPVAVNGNVWAVFRRTGAASIGNFYQLSRCGPSTGANDVVSYGTGTQPWTSAGTGSPAAVEITWQQTGPVQDVYQLSRRILGPWPPLALLPPASEQQRTPMVAAISVAQASRNTERRRFPLQGWSGGGSSQPDTGFSLLDNFDRANNSGPPSANWTHALISIAGDLKIASGRAVQNGTGSVPYNHVGQNYWNQRIYDQPSWFATFTWGGGIGQLELQNRAGDGYQVDVYPQGGIDWEVDVFRFDAGTDSYSQIFSHPFIEMGFADGDQFGVSITTAGVITTWWAKAGTSQWQQVTQDTSTAHTGPWYVGVGVDGLTATVDSVYAAESPAAFLTAQPSVPAGWFGYQRNLGPRLPLVVSPAKGPNEISTKVVALTRRASEPERRPRSQLSGPATLSRPPPASGLGVFLARNDSRPSTSSVLFPPTVVATQVFDAPLAPLVRTRPRRTLSRLSPPTVTQVFAGTAVKLAQTRPRRTIHTLAPPVVVRVPSVEQLEQTIRVSLVHTRPRPTSKVLRGPTTLKVFSGPLVSLTRIRPRPVGSRIGAPTVVAQRTFSGVKFGLVSTRPRRIHSVLAAPVVVSTSTQVFEAPVAPLVRIRPRRTFLRITPPAVLQVFAGPLVALAHTRPRRVVHQLAAPQVIRVPSVEQAEQTIRTSLARTRPRPTTRSLRQPTVLRTFSGPLVKLVATRPRQTRKTLAPPTVVRVPSVEQAEQTLRVVLARTRPRPTVHRLQPPATLQDFFGPVEVQVAVRVPLEDKRRTPHSRLSPPVVLQTFAGPLVAFTKTRPRPTVHALGEPQVVRVPSVEQQEDTIRVTLARTRPRPTVRLLTPPTVLRTFTGPSVTITKTRPRATSKQLFEPTILLVPTVEQRLRTITSKLAQTRPRPTRARLAAPAVIQSNPPVVTEITVVSAVQRTRYEQKRHFPLPGWRQRLVRETGSTVVFPMFDPLLGPRPPQVIDPLPTLREQTIKSALAAVRTRVEAKRHFPLPGFTGQLVRETGSGAAFIQALVKPLLGVRPPTIVGPLPDQKQQTVTSKLVALRTRVEQQRRGARSFLLPPEVVSAAQPVETTIHVELAAVRRIVEQPLHGPHSRLSEPVFYEAKSEISVTTVAARTRAEAPRRAPHSFLTDVSYPAKSEISVSLAVRTRVETQRRAARSKLGRPVVVTVPSVEQAEETIRVVLAGRTRLEASRRNSHWRLTAVSYPTTSKILVWLAGRTRTETARRAAHYKLSLPTTPSPSLGQQTIAVSLVASRPRPTAHRIGLPAALRPVETQIAVSLISTRPRPTFRKLRQPTVLRPAETQTKVSLVHTRPRQTIRKLHPPTVVTPIPPPVVTAIRVLLAGENRLRIPTVRSRLHGPTSIIHPLPGVTYGEDWAASNVEDSNIGATSSPGSSIASASAGVQDSAAVSSTIEDIADTTVESSDKEAGT